MRLTLLMTQVFLHGNPISQPGRSSGELEVMVADKQAFSLEAQQHYDGKHYALITFEMNRADKFWTNVMRSRFVDRELLSRDECYNLYFGPLNLPKEEVLECLDLIEFEFEVPVGLLRPNDRLSVLFTRVPTKNPWKWLVYRMREEDSQSELNYRLSKKLRQYTTFEVWKNIHIETIEDLLRAWSGEHPTV